MFSRQLGGRFRPDLGILNLSKFVYRIRARYVCGRERNE